MVRPLLLALALAFAAPAAAQAPEAATAPAIAPGGTADDLPAAVAEEQISVSSDYRGTVIDVWGVNPDRRGRGDVVVVVRGPSQPAVVMRKRRVAGLWVNGDPVHFSEAPAFFAVLSTRPLRQIASPQAIWSLQLDPAASARLAGATPEGTDPSDYRAALVRLRESQGLYQEVRNGIRIYSGGMFRAQVRLPANAPIARYHADTYLFRDGRLISSARRELNVSRVGVERRIHDLATNASLIYGVLTVMLALAAGWIAAYLFRRS
jgi:uncharacterized protein (TIGR02186 family)